MKNILELTFDELLEIIADKLGLDDIFNEFKEWCKSRGVDIEHEYWEGWIPFLKKLFFKKT